MAYNNNRRGFRSRRSKTYAFATTNNASGLRIDSDLIIATPATLTTAGGFTLRQLLESTRLKQPSIQNGFWLPLRLTGVVHSPGDSQIINGNPYVFEESTIKWPNGGVSINDSQNRPAKARPSREVYSASWFGFYGGTTSQTGTDEDVLHVVNLETGLEVDPDLPLFRFNLGSDIDYIDVAVRGITARTV